MTDHRELNERMLTQKHSALHMVTRRLAEMVKDLHPDSKCHLLPDGRRGAISMVARDVPLQDLDVLSRLAVAQIDMAYGVTLTHEIWTDDNVVAFVVRNVWDARTSAELRSGAAIYSEEEALAKLAGRQLGDSLAANVPSLGKGEKE